MMEMLALGAVSGGMNLLSGIGKQQSSAKQGRLQMIADAQAREENARQLALVNEARERLGRELLTIPEVSDTTTENWSSSSSAGNTRTDSAASSRSRGGDATDNYSYVDVDAMMAAAKKSGFNPVTWLNAGGMQAYTQTGSRSSNWNDLDTYEWSETSSWQTSDDYSGQRQRIEQSGHNAADAYKLMVPEYTLSQASQVPQQYSMLEALGGAGSAALSTFTDLYKAQNAIDSKEKLFNKQLDAILAGAGASKSGGGIGGGGSSGSMITNGGNASVNRGLSGSGSDNKEIEKLKDFAAAVESQPFVKLVNNNGEVKWPEVTVTNMSFPPAKTAGDAQQSEDRYGELGGIFKGAANMVDDGVQMMTGKSLREWGRHNGVNVGEQKGNSLPEKAWTWYNLPAGTRPAAGLPYDPFPGSYPGSPGGMSLPNTYTPRY